MEGERKTPVVDELQRANGFRSLLSLATALCSASSVWPWLGKVACPSHGTKYVQAETWKLLTCLNVCSCNSTSIRENETGILLVDERKMPSHPETAQGYGAFLGYVMACPPPASSWQKNCCLLLSLHSSEEQISSEKWENVETKENTQARQNNNSLVTKQSHGSLGPPQGL